MLSIAENQKSDNPTQGNQLRLLRDRLAEHIKNPEYPGHLILSALQGSGLSTLEAALAWNDLELQVSKAWRDAFETSGDAHIALLAQHQKRKEIAARILAAKEL